MSSSIIDVAPVQRSIPRFPRRVCFLFITLVILVSSGGQVVRPQGCCSVGASSLGGFESGVQKVQTLRAGVNYQFNSVTRAFQGTSSLDDPLARTASVSYFSLHAEYGVQRRLSLYALLYFSDKSREITVRNANSGFSETAGFGTSGIGDLTVLVKYQVIAPTITSPFELAVGGGASLPTGSFTREQNNAQLSIDLQPGTGATALIAWGFSAWSFPASRIRLSVSASYRYAGTNFDGYRLGDEVFTNLGGEYGVNDHFSLSLLLRSRFAGQDYANRRSLGATGGTFHDLMPAIVYADGPSQFRTFAQVPLYRNVPGIQLTLAYMIGVEYSYTFDFTSPTQSDG